MNRLLILFLLLSSSIIVYSQQLSTSDCISRNLISTAYASAIYKMKIEVYGQNFSGLVVIKNEERKDLHYKIVFLSEVGLTLVYLDYDRKTDKIELVSVADFLNNKQLLAVLKADFRMMVKGLSCQKLLKTKKKTKRIREKGIRYVYDRDCSCIMGAKRWYGFFFSSELSVGDYEHSIPRSLQVHHKGIKLHISMNLIKYSS